MAATETPRGDDAAPTSAEGTGSLVCHAKRSNTGSAAAVPVTSRPTDCYHCCCCHRTTAASAMRTTAMSDDVRAAQVRVGALAHLDDCNGKEGRGGPGPEFAPSSTLTTAMGGKEGAELLAPLILFLPSPTIYCSPRSPSSLSLAHTTVPQALCQICCPA